MSVWRRAELLGLALWPELTLASEAPPAPWAEWKRRGRASTPAERAEVVALLEEGWSVGQVADATGWSIAQVKMWRKRARTS